MPLTSVRPTIDLGARVHHRSDRTKPVGVVVGVLFRPYPLVLVRWRDRTTTFEAPEDLVVLHLAA
jgi:hypothetical protein